MDDLISRQQTIYAVENCEPGEELFVIKSLPSIDAIPLEWIAGWMGKHQGLEFDGWNFAVGTMVRDWEKRKES